MNIQISNQSTVTHCSPETDLEIRRRLTFPNPAYQENERRGFSTWGIDRLIQCFDSILGGLSFPRGFTGQACRIARKNGEQIQIDDRRRALRDVDFTFAGKLKPFQQEAVEAVLQKAFGTLQAPTGSGKTVMALAIIAARKQPALIVVHTKELLTQWIDRVETFLGIPKAEIGVIGGGKMRIGQKITVALVQSLIKHAEDVFEHVGFLVVDECHRCPSKTFLDIVTTFDCRYMLGLSATPWRRDGLTRLIWYYLGDKVHEVNGQHLVDAGHICTAQVVTVETEFRTDLDGSTQYSKMLSELCADKNRNKLIALHTAAEASGNTGITLMLSDRKSHCEALREVLSDIGTDASVLTGDTPAKERTALTGRLATGDCKLLIGTAQLLSEGFDCPAISSVVLASPIKFSGKLIQCVGRSLRPAPGKDHAQIIDFMDSRVGVLAAGAKYRARTFGQMPGVSLVDPQHGASK
ncbi:MAG: DEAD/DEAH box helicase [Deltaproteobacteria bacterium]|nr:DEAD/DEAH box helicase [Deltaproteobacteria bacterium]